MPAWAVLIIAIGSIASAILAVWTLLERFGKKFSKAIDEKIDKALTKNNQIQEKQMKLLIEVAINEQSNKISSFSKDFNRFKKSQTKINQKQLELSNHQRDAILEMFKQDIRDIYYGLRNTGSIDDRDKSYMDKIYNYYALLGGNSDIHAKVKELNEVYSRRTHESYDEKAEKNKQGKKLITEDKKSK